MADTQDMQSGRTSQVHSVHKQRGDFKAVLESVISVTGKTPRCLRLKTGGCLTPTAVWETDGRWLTELSTRNISCVSQRRRRIYLVADFAGDCAGEILFEPKGVSRDFTPCGSPWQRTAGDARTALEQQATA